MIKVERDDKNKTSKMIYDISILKARGSRRGKQNLKRPERDKQVELVLIVATLPSKGIRSRKRRREAEEI